MRKEYEMTEQDSAEILEACRWDRSRKWSQFRSSGRQRGWWLDRVRRDRRVRPRRSARCEKRGRGHRQFPAADRRGPQTG
jgi:hypothetical protein